MARNLEKLLENTSPYFGAGLSNLEHASGKKGIDVKLIADITEKVHDIVKKLGLNYKDSLAREVYYSLIAAVDKIDFIENLLAENDYVIGDFDGELISFNLIDVIESYHRKLPFEKRIKLHAQRALRGEILDRYISEETIPSDMIHRISKQSGILLLEDKKYPRLSDVFKNKDQNPSILAIGDIFSDAFIELDERYVEVKRIDGEDKLILPFGSKPPYKKVDVVQSVGPSPNAAVSFSRLGLRTYLMSWLGDDQPGVDSIKTLHAENINVDLVDIKKDTPSNYYYVLKFGADRTILVKNQEYNYVWKNPKDKVDWVYLSLISDKSWRLHEEMLDYLRSNPEVKLAFQPGTFHFEWGAKKLKEVYKRSEIVIMNREEAVQVTGEKYDDLKALSRKLHEMGPKFIVITDGPNGSYAYDGEKLMTIQNYPDPADPVDRTGAGDAFASTIVAMLAKGRSFEEAITFAPINSMNVVQHLGAQKGLLKESEIEEFIKKAPDWYKVKEIK